MDSEDLGHANKEEKETGEYRGWDKRCKKALKIFKGTTYARISNLAGESQPQMK